MKLKKITKKTKGIFTFEDNYISGGFGSLIQEKISEHNIHRNFFVKMFGIKKEFISKYGTEEDLHKDQEIDEENLYKKIKKILK